MALDRRQIFVRKWFKKAIDETDPFDRFFSFWIALIIAAQRKRTERGYGFIEDDTDRQKVLDYFEWNREKVFQVLKQKRSFMEKLIHRRGTNYGNPILDSGNPNLRQKFQRLKDYYVKETAVPEEELIETVGEIFNKVRNNLFHGVKVYDDTQDVSLVELLNPILQEILQKCESIKD